MVLFSRQSNAAVMEVEALTKFTIPPLKNAKFVGVSSVISVRLAIAANTGKFGLNSIPSVTKRKKVSLKKLTLLLTHKSRHIRA